VKPFEQWQMEIAIVLNRSHHCQQQMKAALIEGSKANLFDLMKS
jgi:hypothetical protein